MQPTTTAQQLPNPVKGSAAKSAAPQKSLYPRETMLMWIIGTASGAAMLTLLIAMCLAEISIHRTAARAATAPAPAAPVALAAGR